MSTDTSKPESGESVDSNALLADFIPLATKGYDDTVESFLEAGELLNALKVGDEIRYGSASDEWSFIFKIKLKLDNKPCKVPCFWDTDGRFYMACNLLAKGYLVKRRAATI